MRVTENITRNMYLRNHNRSQTNLLKSYNRIMTQRRFNRVSEDSISGNKAMMLRRQLRNLDIYEDNLSTAKELFNAAESNLNMIGHNLYISVEEQLTASVNGTYSQDELDIFANTLEQIAESMVSCLNNDFGERNIFGGTNNGSAPFRLERAVMTSSEDVALYKDADGNVLTQDQYDILTDGLTDDEIADLGYEPLSDEITGEVITGKKIVYPPNWDEYYTYDAKKGTVTLKDGITVDDIPRTVLYNDVPVSFEAVENEDIKAGTYDVITVDLGKSGNNEYKHTEYKLTNESLKYARLKKDNSYIFPGSEPIYVDIGIGIRYDTNYEVDSQTALDTSINGAACVGSGMEVGHDGQTFSKNLIQLVLDAAEALRKGDQSYPNAVIDRANAANNGVLKEITTLGTKQNDIEFYESRVESYRFNLSERQNLVEGTDMEAEISNWYNLQAAYDAFLKIGTSVIPTSIFDFV